MRNGAIGKVERVECQFGDPGRPCDLPEQPAEPGLDWNLWLGPAPMRPYNSILSPRGMHDNFPDWRNYREFGGGMVTDWGAHHLDIAQWGLGMDDSGPVEILPPAAGKKRGAKLVYANGVTVEHTNGFGVEFFGSEGVVQVNRGKFTFKRGDEMIASFTGKKGDAKESETSLAAEVQKADRGLSAGRQGKALREQQSRHGFHAMRARAQEAHHERAGGRALGDLLPLDEPGLLPRPEAPVGSGESRLSPAAPAIRSGSRAITAVRGKSDAVVIH